MTWKFVATDPPPKGETVLVWCAEYEDYDYLSFNPDADVRHRWFSPWSGNYQSAAYAEKISHWMPMPAPPSASPSEDSGT